MTMFEDLVSGWKLGAAIRKLVFKDKRLFIFPVLAGILIGAEAIAVFGSLFYFGYFTSPLAIALVFLYYIIVYFTSVYILVAMFVSFRGFMAKKPISFSAAMSKASSYKLLILEWAVFEGIVTMIIRAIEQRLGPIGSAIFGFGASLAMGLATAFAVPVIVDKKTGPISTIKESTAFIMHNFGKTFGGLIYSELYSLIFSGIGIILIIGAVFVLGSIPIAAAVAIGVVGLVRLAYGMILGYILSNIYRFVLYDYKNGAALPEGISKDMVDSSIRQRKSAARFRFGGSGGGTV